MFVAVYFYRKTKFFRMLHALITLFIGLKTDFGESNSIIEHRRVTEFKVGIPIIYTYIYELSIYLSSSSREGGGRIRRINMFSTFNLYIIILRYLSSLLNKCLHKSIAVPIFIYSSLNFLYLTFFSVILVD